MNLIKDIMALKPAESLTVDIKFRDGRWSNMCCLPSGYSGYAEGAGR